MDIQIMDLNGLGKKAWEPFENYTALISISDAISDASGTKEEKFSVFVYMVKREKFSLLHDKDKGQARAARELSVKCLVVFGEEAQMSSNVDSKKLHN